MTRPVQSGEELLELMRAYQVPAVLGAAAQLGVFDRLVEGPRNGRSLAEACGCDARGIEVLLNALVAARVLTKSEGRYALPERLAPYLQSDSPDSVVPMLRHQEVCLRRWSQLAFVVRSGRPAQVEASVRGEEADRESFIEAMDVVSRPVARSLVREVAPASFRCVLDVGGGPGTWTLAWLELQPNARAILFDLPEVLPIPRRRLERAGVLERVQLVGGDFYCDPLPTGADVVWLSAIIHQNSREQNRALFRKIADSLPPGGQLLIRDVVMNEDRTRPPAGALFAVNMLVATDGGGTFTLSEIREDLTVAGFVDVELVRQDEGMNSVVRARLPGR